MAKWVEVIYLHVDEYREVEVLCRSVVVVEVP